MDNRRWYLVVFSICVFLILAVAMVISFFHLFSQTQSSSSLSSLSPSSSSSGTLPYGTKINGGEIGIRMHYNSVFCTRMSVVISYNTEFTSATNFFQKQLTADLFQKVSDCGVVNWYFMPCGISKLNNMRKFDKLHACVATLSKKDEIAVGKFVICFFNSNRDVNKCIGDAGLGQMQNDINQCADTNGANYCNAFNKLIHTPVSQSQKSYTVSLSSTESVGTDGTSNFKDVLCQNLATAKLECGFCSV